MTELSTKDARRFWDKVLLDDGCWEWTAARNDSGYGTFYLAGSFLKAHRVAYEQMVGPIPDGLVLDHLCSNRACVRPDHLEPVTQNENLRRGGSFAALAAKSAERGRSTTCPKGHPYTDDNVYLTPAGGRRCVTCRRARGLEYYHRKRAEGAALRRLGVQP